MLKKFILIFLLLVASPQSFASATEWIDFTIDNGLIKIPVEVGGKPAYAILDTGANINSINQNFIEENEFEFDKGRTIEIEGAFETDKRRRTYNNVPTKLFGIDLELDKLVSLELGSPSNALLIGAGFFDDFIVQLDYPNSKMRLIQRGAIDLAKLKNINMRVDENSRRPIVKVNFKDDKSDWVLLDTGSNGGLTVDRNVAKKRGWLEKYQSDATYAAGVNSVRTMDSFRIDLVKFGPFELENILVNVPAEGETSKLVSQYKGTTGSRIRGPKVNGILGYDILQHFLITIDYKKGHAHIGLPE
jgi:predicted aspartyl protease